MRTSRKIEEKKNYFFELYLNDNIILNAEQNKIPLLFILTRRAVIFTLLYLTVTTLFFFVGNYQKFLDSNLTIIIKTAAVTSTALVSFSLAGAAECMIFIFSQKAKKLKKLYAFQLVFMIFSGLTGMICLLVYRTIDLLSRGVN